MSGVRIIQRVVFGFVTASALALALGCAEELPSRELGSSAPASRFGHLSITYSEHRVPGGVDPQVIASGLFARHIGVSKTDVVSAIVSSDGFDDTPVVGACRVESRALGLRPGEDHFVDLVDAGELRVNAPAGSVRLDRRSFPEVYPAVTGLTYEGTLPRPELGEDTPLRIEGRGSYEVGPFVVEATLPAVPSLLAVDGTPVTGPYAAVRWDADLEVRWAVPEPNRRAATALIDVVVLGYDRVTTLRCATPDSGLALLPRAGLAALADARQPDATTRLVVQRVRHAPFAAAGIHGGEVVVSSRDAVLVE